MELTETLRERFTVRQELYPEIAWEQVAARLAADSLAAIQYLEASGGEPSFFIFESRWFFADFSPETPVGRRNQCYDRAAREGRKKNAPATSATEEATAHGVTLVSEATYFEMQKIHPLDTKTSSWLMTPREVRAAGGAIFGDHRFGRTFIYHNGAHSYYSARGFRAYVEI